MADESNASDADGKRVGKLWSIEDERKLYDGFVSGGGIDDLARLHRRGLGGIRSRLKLLGLMDADGCVVSPTPSFLPSSGSLPFGADGKPLNVRETMFLRLLRKIPRGKHKVAFGVMRALVDQAKFSSKDATDGDWVEGDG